MLVIRNEQMKVFEEAGLRKYEDEMLQYIKQFAPTHSDIIGERGVRRVVRMGIERAKEYGLTNRGPVSFYIELMFMLGSDFDTDPQYLWAGEGLNESAVADQMVRADRLYDKAMDYVEKISGPERKHEKEALRRVNQMHIADLPVSGGNFEGEILRHLNRIHPEKCVYIGESAIGILVRRASEAAKSYAVGKGIGPALFAGLMFAFGHGCFTDPQFPWIEGTLNNASLVDPHKKAERLYSKMMTYFNNALALMEKR